MKQEATLPMRAAGLRDGDLTCSLTVRFTERDRAHLMRYARRHGVSAGDVVRVAIAGVVGSPPRIRPSASESDKRAVR
jgi:hypothetical protein